MGMTECEPAYFLGGAFGSKNRDFKMYVRYVPQRVAFPVFKDLDHEKTNRFVKLTFS